MAALHLLSGKAVSELMEMLSVDLERTGQDPQHLPHAQEVEALLLIFLPRPQLLQ